MLQLIFPWICILSSKIIKLALFRRWDHKSVFFFFLVFLNIVEILSYHRNILQKQNKTNCVTPIVFSKYLASFQFFPFNTLFSINISWFFSKMLHCLKVPMYNLCHSWHSGQPYTGKGCYTLRGTSRPVRMLIISPIIPW